MGTQQQEEALQNTPSPKTRQEEITRKRHRRHSHNEDNSHFVNLRHREALQQFCESLAFSCAAGEFSAGGHRGGRDGGDWNGGAGLWALPLHLIPIVARRLLVRSRGGSVQLGEEATTARAPVARS